MSSDPEPWSASVDGRQTPTYAEQDASKRSLEGQLALDPSVVVPPSIAEPLAPAPSSPLVFRADTTAIRAELTAELPASALGLIPPSPPATAHQATLRIAAPWPEFLSS
ncbi:unnamed protein product [Tilletia controversa]|nr:unnamed protein product [Tilletia controversa]CAD6936942.1 unnamed protein product [Tilletia controversa]